MFIILIARPIGVVSIFIPYPNSDIQCCHITKNMAKHFNKSKDTSLLLFPSEGLMTSIDCLFMLIIYYIEYFFIKRHIEFSGYILRFLI